MEAFDAFESDKLSDSAFKRRRTVDQLHDILNKKQIFFETNSNVRAIQEPSLQIFQLSGSRNTVALYHQHFTVMLRAQHNYTAFRHLRMYDKYLSIKCEASRNI